jgi:hypothetical protein
MRSACDALDVQLTAKERVRKVAASLPAGGFNQVSADVPQQLRLSTSER